MAKIISRIRRERLDRLFVGLHSQKIEGKESWIELGHMIKGVDFAYDPVEETNGLLQVSTGAGGILKCTGEFAQNTVADFRDYDGIAGPKRNVALVTGKGPVVVIRLFRLVYAGAGKWIDNRVSISTSDKYADMDKVPFKLGGWTRGYEMYAVKNLHLSNARLQYDIVDTRFLQSQPTGPTGKQS